MTATAAEPKGKAKKSKTKKADPNVVTDERAKMLAQHATLVQGGLSDPERERERAEKQLARSPGSIDWDQMQAEVHEAVLAALTGLTEPAPTPAPTPTMTATVDVTHVLAHIDQGAALRDRIAALKADLKVHEDKIKDAMGEAVEGVDARGNVLVRLPHRNRTTLVSKEVEKRLSPLEYAACQNVTSYRQLLYGD